MESIDCCCRQGQDGTLWSGHHRPAPPGPTIYVSFHSGCGVGGPKEPFNRCAITIVYISIDTCIYIYDIYERALYARGRERERERVVAECPRSFVLCARVSFHEASAPLSGSRQTNQFSPIEP